MIKNMVLVLADLGVQIPAPLLTSWVTLVNHFPWPSAAFPALRWDDMGCSEDHCARCWARVGAPRGYLS